MFKDLVDGNWDLVESPPSAAVLTSTFISITKSKFAIVANIHIHLSFSRYLQMVTRCLASKMLVDFGSQYSISPSLS